MAAVQDARALRVPPGLGQLVGPVAAVPVVEVTALTPAVARRGFGVVDVWRRTPEQNDVWKRYIEFWVNRVQNVYVSKQFFIFFTLFVPTYKLTNKHIHIGQNNTLRE